MSETYRMELIRSKRKTLSLRITQDAVLQIRAPYQMSDREIRNFLLEKQDWIEKNIAKMREEMSLQKKIIPFTEKELKDLTLGAKDYFPKKAKDYAEQMGVTFERITIKKQKTRWGSCSSKGNLNFNCLLMELPESTRDYVIVHELSHRIHMNHSPAFWRTVKKYCPDYKKEERILKEQGSPLLKRLRVRA